MQPILLFAPAGSGKDTAARLLAAHFGLAVHHLADPILATLNTPAWQATMNHLIQAGTDPAIVLRRAKQIVGDAFRALDENVLVDTLVARARTDAPAVVVPDVRLPNELDRLRVLWPQALAIYCDVPPAVRAKRLRERDGAMLNEAAANHHTEQEVLTLRARADWVWDNGADVTTTWPLLQAWVAAHQLTEQ